MTAAVKAQWLIDLRSGEYPQGRGALKTTSGGFCCIGVLCDRIPGRKWEMDGSGDIWLELPGGYFSRYMGPVNRLGQGAQLQLMQMNDKLAQSFTTIADWIEQHVETHDEPI